MADPIDVEGLAAGRRCAGCGAALAEHDRYCGSCGGRNVPTEELSRGQSTPGGASGTQPSNPLARGFRCTACGAAIAFDAAAGALRCAFCDSRFVEELPPAPERPVPAAVLPFEVDRGRAETLFRGWLAAGWFRPSDLARGARVERLAGVYLPFWSCSARVHSCWTADREAPATSRSDWAPVSGEREDRFEEVLVLASGGLSESEVAEVEPFDLSRRRPCSPELLAGRLAEVVALRREEARPRALQGIALRAREACARGVPGHRSRNLKVNWLADSLTAESVLLPVHIASYAYGGKVYRFLVNGQSGEVVGHAPLSPWKVGGAVTAALLAALLLALALALALVLGSGCAAAPSAARAPLPDLVERYARRTVAIEVLREDGEVFVGSGLVLDGRGRVITNHHVVEGATELMAFWDSGLGVLPVRADVLATDPERDLALVRVALPDGVPAWAVPFCREEDLRLGSPVTILGFPDLSQPYPGDEADDAGGEPRLLGGYHEKRLTVFAGVISSLHRRADRTLEKLFTDATILGGISGGPVLDLDTGSLAGLATEVYVESETPEDAPEAASVEWGTISVVIPVGEVRRFLAAAERRPP
ncbi:MAG: trypsin-like peptidase domain-containing protein [Planctomycetes bacterium]|nr:trypsin-like peptidase domain-containing protein [Planctomycetota bacterium]